MAVAAFFLALCVLEAFIFLGWMPAEIMLALAPAVLFAASSYGRSYYLPMLAVLYAASLFAIAWVEGGLNAEGFEHALTNEVTVATVVMLLISAEILEHGRRRRCRVERALRASEERLRRLAESTSDIVWRIDDKGRLIEANAAVERILGYSVDELLGMDFNRLLTAPARARVEHDLAAIPGGADPGTTVSTPHRAEYEHVHKDGHVVECEVAFVLLHNRHGEYEGAVGSTRDISERKRAERALRASEERYRMMTENVSDVVWSMALDGRVIYISPSIERILGYLPGQDEELTMASILMPEDHERALAVLRERLATDGERRHGKYPPLVLEVCHKHKNGTAVPCEVSAIFTRDEDGLPNALVGVTRDISERKRAEEALQRRDAILQAVAYAATRFLTTPRWEDESGNVLRRIGEATQVSSAYVFEVSPNADGTHEASIRCRWDQPGRPIHVQLEDLRNLSVEQTGFERWVHELSQGNIICGHLKDFPERERRFFALENTVSVAVMPIFAGERWWGFIGFDENDEERLWPPAELDALRAAAVALGAAIRRQEAEEERDQLEAQVQNAQKLESLGVLAGGIAHDFNNLLMGVLGNADLALARMRPAEPARRNVEEIEVAARRAAELCKQMLAYSGRGTFIVESVELSSLVKEMANLLEVSISKSTALRYDFREGTPPIMADSTQLRQVVMNLILNASEAFGEKAGEIVVRTGSMRCNRRYLREAYMATGLSEGVYAYLEVSDAGCGMAEQEVGRIFDPFYTTKFTGRGLGLAAVLGIVRAHEGAIHITTAPGQGTTFRVLFPVADKEVQLQADPMESADGWQASGTVLVIDDEPAVRDVAREMLADHGLNVLVACDGLEGLETFKSRRAEIDLVLLDMTMPRLGGKETFRELRGIDPEVRVILSSGYNEGDAIAQFGRDGLAGFIQKPYEAADLMRVVRAAFGT